MNIFTIFLILSFKTFANLPSSIQEMQIVESCQSTYNEAEERYEKKKYLRPLEGVEEFLEFLDKACNIIVKKEKNLRSYLYMDALRDLVYSCQYSTEMQKFERCKGPKIELLVQSNFVGIVERETYFFGHIWKVKKETETKKIGNLNLVMAYDYGKKIYDYLLTEIDPHYYGWIQFQRRFLDEYKIRIQNGYLGPHFKKQYEYLYEFEKVIYDLVPESYERLVKRDQVYELFFRERIEGVNEYGAFINLFFNKLIHPFDLLVKFIVREELATTTPRYLGRTKLEYLKSLKKFVGLNELPVKE